MFGRGDQAEQDATLLAFGRKEDAVTVVGALCADLVDVAAQVSCCAQARVADVAHGGVYFGRVIFRETVYEFADGPAPRCCRVEAPAPLDLRASWAHRRKITGARALEVGPTSSLGLPSTTSHTARSSSSHTRTSQTTDRARMLRSN